MSRLTRGRRLPDHDRRQDDSDRLTAPGDYYKVIESSGSRWYAHTPTGDQGYLERWDFIVAVYEDESISVRPYIESAHWYGSLDHGLWIEEER